jgi:MFS family permease
VIARCRVLLSVPGFRPLLFSAIVGRLPTGMFSLALVLFVRAQTGSFLDAGAAVGAFTLAGALVGPALAALVDRLGQTRVLLCAATAQATLLVALVAVAQRRAPLGAVIAAAALAGAATPPIAGCVRALWPSVARERELLETVYSLDATVQELIWTVGPLLVGVSATLLSPAAAVLLCAAITLCGTALFAGSALSRGWRAQAGERARGGALGSGGLRVLLLTVACAGVSIGAVEVGLPALAVHLGVRWSAGALLALFSVGSMAGGLLYAAHVWRGAAGRRYLAILLALALLVAPLSVAGSLGVALACSLAAGLAVAPMIACQFSLVGALAPPGTATEAFTWHRGATIAGGAAGTALGGWLVDRVGAGAPFLLACGGAALAALVALPARRRIAPGEEPDHLALAARHVALAAAHVAAASEYAAVDRP